jgi:hypothetical protein
MMRLGNMAIKLIKIISMHSKQNYFCRICGLEHQDLPWGEDGKTSSFDFCECCGCQFGYQDCLLESILKYRSDWIQSGAKWSEPNFKPLNWNLNEQLDRIDPIYL